MISLRLLNINNNVIFLLNNSLEFSSCIIQPHNVGLLLNIKALSITPVGILYKLTKYNVQHVFD